MPWLAVDKAYQFDGARRQVSLVDLFGGRRPLLAYRAFYGPEVTTYAEGGWYRERACVGCSLVADQVARPAHLNARTTTLVFASRAPGRDPGPEAAPPMGARRLVHDHRRLRYRLRRRRLARHNAFVCGGDRIFRTYLINARGDEQMGSRWNSLDVTALGRQEQWEDSPEGYRKPRRTGGGTTTTPPPRATDHPVSAVSVQELPRSRRGRARPGPQQRHPSSSSLWRNEQRPSPNLNNVRDILPEAPSITGAGAARMVRMGSPVRFRRGLHINSDQRKRWSAVVPWLG